MGGTSSNLWQDETSSFTGTLPVSAGHWPAGSHCCKGEDHKKRGEKSIMFENKMLKTNYWLLPRCPIVIAADNDFMLIVDILLSE